MHHVGRADWSIADSPSPPSATSSGLFRSVVVGPDQGAVHTELAIGGLAPGGWLQRHVHSFEEALYVLAGELLLDIGGRAHRLVQGDFALMNVGVWHALGNDGSEQVRWLSVNTPQRLGPESGRRDTYFASDPFRLEALAERARRPPFGDPTLRFVGHYLGTPPQAEAFGMTAPARSRGAAGMDTAVLAYNGISVKMLVDRTFGADLLTMFTVDYEVDAGVPAHDHPFEETYFFLEGEVEAELDGREYTIGAGDVVFAAVGATHGFFNTGSGRVRWIETQAPQPPVRHAYRWPGIWKRFESEG